MTISRPIRITQANEVVTEKSPTGGLTTYTYDLDGNVLSVTDPDDHKITYSYNADNEETGETWVNPPAARRWTCSTTPTTPTAT